MGIISGENFLCEDSGLFNVPLSYTAIAKTDALVYRIASSDMLNIWPKECTNELKIRVLEKYKWFYERLLRVEDLLMNNKHNNKLIMRAQEIETHTLNNYPVSSTQARQALKKTHLQIAEQNPKIYLTSQNRRIHKHAKPLTGYVDDKDLKRLDKIKQKMFYIDESQAKKDKQRLSKSIEINHDKVGNSSNKYRLSSLGMHSP